MGTKQSRNHPRSGMTHKIPHGLASLALCVVAAAGCQNPDTSQRTFFVQRISPILEENCVRGTADNRCHVEDPNRPGEALGNLDLSSFEAVHRRPELLNAYGSYPEPILLLKAVKPEEVSLQYGSQTHQSEVFHAGGGILSRNSAAFIELEQWLRDGATEDGQPPEVESPSGSGQCATALRPDVTPFLGQAAGPLFDQYLSDVEPILRDRCSFGSCHGSSQSDLYLTCGDTPEQQQHNFIVAQSFVSDVADRSELLLRPLSTNAGGGDHSGGDIWSSASDGDFTRLREWAAAVGPLVLPDTSPGFTYFRDRVMPVLLKRGCAMPQCHSPQGFNDYRLRAGSRGFFSPLALARNYETTLHEFVSIDTPDPNQSRILKKNIIRERRGIIHRAGITLLDIFGTDQGGDPTLCAAGQDEQPTSYCVLVEWLRREREEAVAEGLVTPLAEGDTIPVIYVQRPPNPDRAIDFATYRGGASLMRVDVPVGPLGALVPPAGGLAGSPIDLSSCGAGADIDVRGPEISFDATRMVFALRNGQADGLNVYESDLDGANCVQLTSDGGQTDSGVPIHNFDPVYAPPDPEHQPGGAIVFASTRPGRLGRSVVSPRYRLPASDLWRMAIDGSNPEQMTFVNGSEFSPAIMQNGQVTMSAEKATETFYQVAGRRINWDRTDYHPLLAQRASVGFEQGTEIREGLDRDFLVIMSNANSWFQGGALVAFNRSLGPFQISREFEPGYVGAVNFLDPAAREAGKGPSEGAYRSPFAAPDGQVLASYTAGQVDLTNQGAAVDYDLVLVDPATGGRTVVVASAGTFEVEGVIAYRRALRRVFVNIPELVFGGTSIAEAVTADEAWAHFPDLPMVATLLTNNDRGPGRGLEALEGGDTIALYRADPPPAGSTDDGSTFQSWELLGTAPLEADGSVFLRAPAGVPVIIELRQGDTPLLTMTEEHQFGPGELTSLGVSREFFDGVCGGCHGSTAGPELDVVVNSDALTGASVSAARPEPGATPSTGL